MNHWYGYGLHCRQIRLNNAVSVKNSLLLTENGLFSLTSNGIHYLFKNNLHHSSMLVNLGRMLVSVSKSLI